MRRVIPIQVTDEYVRGAGAAVGAAGSHDDVLLRMEFGPMWAGTARSIVWLDANGENPTITALTTAMLADGETEIYLVPIPAEPKAVAGEMTMTVKGVTVSGSKETTATLTAAARFRVLESSWDPDAEESADITPTQAQQFQAEIEGIKSGVAAAKAAGAAAAESEKNARASETAAAASASQAADSKSAAAESAVAAAGSAGSAARSQAAAAAAQGKAEAAQAAAEAAKSAAEASEDAAAESEKNAKASETAAAGSASSAAESAGAAAGSEGNAKDAASAASAAAAAAAASRDAAAASQEAAGDSAGTAEYWARQAAATVGGDFATKQQAQGYVSEHDQSAAAHPDIREKLEDHTHTKEQITDFPSAMAPIAHKDSHKTGGADAISPGDIGAAAATHNHTKSQITDFPATMAPAAHKDSHKTGGADALSPGDIGAAPASHSHTKSDITDFPSAMTPTAHKDSHKTGGADAITPEDIGAAQATHSHTKSQITDFPTSFVDPADPATEGYVKLGVLTGSNQSFTVPVIPSEIMIAANNISGGSIAPSVVFDDSDDGVSLGSARKPQYSGSASYSSLSFRKILHLAGFDTYYGASDGGVYAHTEVSSSTNSWLASQKTLKLETTFKAKLSSEPRSGTVELWYHR